MAVGAMVGTTAGLHHTVLGPRPTAMGAATTCARARAWPRPPACRTSRRQLWRAWKKQWRQQQRRAARLDSRTRAPPRTYIAASGLRAGSARRALSRRGCARAAGAAAGRRGSACGARAQRRGDRRASQAERYRALGGGRTARRARGAHRHRCARAWRLQLHQPVLAARHLRARALCMADVVARAEPVPPMAGALLALARARGARAAGRARTPLGPARGALMGQRCRARRRRRHGILAREWAVRRVMRRRARHRAVPRILGAQRLLDPAGSARHATLVRGSGEPDEASQWLALRLPRSPCRALRVEAARLRGRLRRVQRARLLRGVPWTVLGGRLLFAARDGARGRHERALARHVCRRARAGSGLAGRAAGAGPAARGALRFCRRCCRCTGPAPGPPDHLEPLLLHPVERLQMALVRTAQRARCGRHRTRCALRHAGWLGRAGKHEHRLRRDLARREVRRAAPRERLARLDAHLCAVARLVPRQPVAA
mmetsp:Transcript_3588/g.10174  ORF Transcript_3588/g.10174 Transcript_3588/m.10174 type:complete len:488 (+) Transcript_3588:710-2173(+)